MLFESVGYLDYSYKDDYGYRLVMNVDKDICNYYRSLIPKSIKPNSQYYYPHVSIVRHETPKNLDFWGKYQNIPITFYYDNKINFGYVYCWLNIFCQKLEEIRLELGLPISSQYTMPPEGAEFKKCFHMTIGNFKNLTQ